MAIFKDTAGNEWDIKPNHADALRVKKETGVELYQLLARKMEGLRTLLSDPEKLVAVVFSILQPTVSPENFGAAIDGEALEAMGGAFLESLCSFFPNKDARTALRSVTDRTRGLQDVMHAKTLAAIAELEKMTPEQLLKTALDSNEKVTA